MPKNVLLDIADNGVATVTLNRPDVLNALDHGLGRDLVESLARCVETPTVKAVILTGAGRGFCAGGDIKAAWTEHQAGKPLPQYFREVIDLLHRATLMLRYIDKPVIAALNGATSGAGISLAAACDLRLAAADAKFKQAYTAIGLTPDGGWTALVPRIIGPAQAMALLLMDPKFDAAQAQALGLVHEVHPAEALLPRAQEIAARLAAGPVTAYAGAKRLINESVFSGLPGQLEWEREFIIGQTQTADFEEGVRAFVEKRPAVFPGR